jgi:hypothetical protein
MNNFVCKKCKKRRVSIEGDICRGCWYEDQVAYMLKQPGDMQDWEFAHCEECGSSLDSKGDCRNTNCGNSPYLGTNFY